MTSVDSTAAPRFPMSFMAQTVADSVVKSESDPKAIVMGDAAIPLIDLNHADRANIFGKGLEEVGFVAVKAEETALLIDRVNHCMFLYFSQALDEKMKDFHDNGGQSGYCPPNTETAAGSEVADNKEHYMLPAGKYDKWPKFGGDSSKAQEFKDVMQAYLKVLTDYAAKSMNLITEYLHEPAEDMSESVLAEGNVLRLIHYPPSSTKAPMSGAHFDLNAITLLPPATRSGLQLRDRDGSWKFVNVPKGYLIFNTGDQVEMKTAGKIKAVEHQVVRTEGGESESRYSSVFFTSMFRRLKPFPRCVAEMTKGMSEAQKSQYLAKYPDVTWLDALISRLIEMATIPAAAVQEDQVRDLRSKGLLRQPKAALVDKFPDLFKSDSKEEKKEQKDDWQKV